MSFSKSKPGPRRRSCHTCWARRKKCDLSRPYCERCLKGGFECLGYEDKVPPVPGHQVDPGVSSLAWPQPILPGVFPQMASLETPGFVRIGSLEGHPDPNVINASQNPCSPILGDALRFDWNTPFSTTRANPNNDISTLINSPILIYREASC
ncbi:hypothetical protein OPQ81_000538 [Rhizoctonia solani]|nr:hypothetical protein OPQ81_000538 [Rhizoctonia solani]